MTIANNIPSWSLRDISNILQSHIAHSISASTFEFISCGCHAVYKVTDSAGVRYILKLGTCLWPQKIGSEVATLMYLRNHTQIPVPAVRGYRVGDWQTDYILMDFVEGQKLRGLWFDLPREEQISYVKQIAGIYAELDRTSFATIGSLRLGGTVTVGPLDTLDTVTAPDGHLIGVTLGPYESLQAFWRGQFDHYITQLADDPLLASNADLCHELRRFADQWIKRAPDSDDYSLFGLECMKMEDIIVRDGRIVALIDLENFQTNVPEYLKLHSPLRLDQKLNEIFAEECKNRGVRAWMENSASKQRYDYCLRSTLLVQAIVPGDYNSYCRNNDIDGLNLRLAEARKMILSTLNGS